MSWRVERALQFSDDFDHRTEWYLGEGGAYLARRFERAVEGTIDRITENPTLGHKHHFRNPKLHDLRSLLVTAPFNKVLLFYRVGPESIELWRLMHGARDLSRRLLEPND